MAILVKRKYTTILSTSSMSTYGTKNKVCSESNSRISKFSLTLFLHCSVPFFYPTLFFGRGRVRFFRTSIRSHHHELYKKPSKSSHSLAHYVRPSLHSLTHSCTCPAHKKTTLRDKNIRQPCVFNVGSQRPHYAY